MDSFFPFLKEIQKEVIAIEDLVLANKTLTSSHSTTDTETLPSEPHPSLPGTEETQVSMSLDEKFASASLPMTQTRFSLPPVTFPLVLRRIKRTIVRRWKKLSTSSEHDRPAPKPHSTLARRIARTTKLLTSLTRLLSTKSEVVARIQKRFIASSSSKLGNGPRSNEDADLAIYMGDIQGMCSCRTACPAVTYGLSRPYFDTAGFTRAL